jgi:hypothetical protein
MAEKETPDFRSFMEAFGVRAERVRRALARAGEAAALERAKPDKLRLSAKARQRKRLERAQRSGRAADK